MFDPKQASAKVQCAVAAYIHVLQYPLPSWSGADQEQSLRETLRQERYGPHAVEDVIIYAKYEASAKNRAAILAMNDDPDNKREPFFKVPDRPFFR